MSTSTLSRRKSDRPTLMTLPVMARAYVVVVTMAGAACLADAARHLPPQDLGLFLGLLALAVVTSTAKIELPLGRSQSNLSLSHAVNFWSLFALGPAPTVVIAAISALAQCTLRTTARNPLHQVVFSVASLTITVWGSGLPLSLALGADPSSLAALVLCVIHISEPTRRA